MWSEEEKNEKIRRSRAYQMVLPAPMMVTKSPGRASVSLRAL